MKKLLLGTFLLTMLVTPGCARRVSSPSSSTHSSTKPDISTTSSTNVLPPLSSPNISRPDTSSSPSNSIEHTTSNTVSQRYN